MNQFELYRFQGEEARQLVNELASLRLKVFAEYPYLYEGTLDYEKKYLETYFSAKNSFVLLVKDRIKDLWIGATTGIWAAEEEENFKAPFIHYGIDPEEVFYFGESVLLPEYRGRGLGKVFFKEREHFARSITGIRYLSFCAVVRNDHPSRPSDYSPLNDFWSAQGFKEIPELTTTYEWLDKGEVSPTIKKMQFWLKKIEGNKMETQKLIENYYQAFNSKNFEKMLSLLSEDVVHDINQGDRMTGKAAFKSFLADMDRYYDEHLEGINIMVNHDGSRASAEFICQGTYKNTCEGLPPAKGQKYNLPVGCFFEVKGGQILRVTNYYNMNDWLKQVK